MNVLFVTLDQFRGDSYHAADHPVVATPTLDRIAREGARLARHYSQAAPCSPGRAALYTGTYQMNNRVVANGTPLDRRLDNVARLARRAGYDPTLFGYTDQGVDPADAFGPADPRLDDYDGVLPGFSIGLYLPNSQAGFIQYLRARGYEVSSGWEESVFDEPNRPAEHSLSAFLTDRFLAWFDRQEPGWFAHLSYLRPHPPYGAAGEYSRLYDPNDTPPAIAPVEEGARHPLHRAALGRAMTAAGDPGEIAAMRAQYYGMVSEVDAQLGRVVAAIEARGEWDETIVVVTSDHGDQLGDHGLKEKLGFFPQSYHILGLWRDPRLAPRVVERFTENVDLLATLAESLGLEVPVQCDGRSLLALLRGETVEWRAAAHYEWDSRFMLLMTGDPPPPDALARRNLCVTLTEDVAYVQFGDGSFRCFDLVADPTWRTECVDAERILAAAQTQLVWRQVHLRREGTDVVLSPERWGNWPASLRPQAVA